MGRHYKLPTEDNKIIILFTIGGAAMNALVFSSIIFYFLYHGEKEWKIHNLAPASQKLIE